MKVDIPNCFTNPESAKNQKASPSRLPMFRFLFPMGLTVYGKNFLRKNVVKWIKVNPDDFYADVVYQDGKKRRIEFYYGSTYLSQSSRVLPVDKNYKEITITNYNGDKRKVL